MKPGIWIKNIQDIFPIRNTQSGCGIFNVPQKKNIKTAIVENVI